MANPRQTGHQIRAGTFTSAGMGSTYAISGFPNQSDQIVDNQIQVPWVAPSEIAVPEYARAVIYADGSQRADGFLGWTWQFSYWTFGMFSYWLTTFWPSGVYSAAVTVMVYDATDTAIYVNAQAYRPVIGQSLDWAVAGYTNIKVKFGFGKVTS